MKTIHTETIIHNGRKIDIRVQQHNGKDEYIIAGFEGQIQKTATYSVSFQTNFDSLCQNGISLVSGLLDVIKKDIQRGLIANCERKETKSKNGDRANAYVGYRSCWPTHNASDSHAHH